MGDYKDLEEVSYTSACSKDQCNSYRGITYMYGSYRYKFNVIAIQVVIPLHTKICDHPGA